MSEERAIRLNKVLRELNISLDRAVDFLKEKGHVIESSPNAKISGAEYNALIKQFSADQSNKAASLEVSEEKRKEKKRFALKENVSLRRKGSRKKKSKGSSKK
jgi:translation initiation factor IF-2